MRYKIIHRQDSLLIFGESETNYVASCQVFLYGDRGFMYNINGNKFYECIFSHGASIMHDMKVHTMEGYVTPAHARLMRSAFRNTKLTVEIGGKGIMAGHDMVWVIIRKS